MNERKTTQAQFFILTLVMSVLLLVPLAGHAQDSQEPAVDAQLTRVLQSTGQQQEAASYDWLFIAAGILIAAASTGWLRYVSENEVKSSHGEEHAPPTMQPSTLLTPITRYSFFNRKREDDRAAEAPQRGEKDKHQEIKKHHSERF